MNKSIVVDAEFVEIGKHQKVSTIIETMDLLDAKIAMNVWWQTKTYPETFNKSTRKEIRSRLRSFGWYIVKTSSGYKLMEEASFDDFVEEWEHKDVLSEAWGLANLFPFLFRRMLQNRNLHVVWVPSLKTHLILRSVT
jgi:hypothetical protein